MPIGARRPAVRAPRGRRPDRPRRRAAGWRPRSAAACLTCTPPLTDLAPRALDARARHGVENRVLIDSVHPIQVDDVGRLSEVIDAERIRAMPTDRSEPRQ